MRLRWSSGFRIIGTLRKTSVGLGMVGAGLDGVPFSKRMTLAMFFVRCKKGVSHNPGEPVESAGVAAAITALTETIRSLTV